VITWSFKTEASGKVRFLHILANYVRKNQRR